MQDAKKLKYELAVARDNFTLNYRERLNQANLDDETIKVLYDLGAEIKHTFDAFAEAIETYTTE